jgi:hypothetical protein
VMPDYSLKSFVKSDISYKEHMQELSILMERLKKYREGGALSDECSARLFLLITAQIQKIINKIDLMLIYLLASIHKASITKSSIEDFVLLNIHILESEIVDFHIAVQTDPVTACQKIIPTVASFLTSTVKYTECVMTDEFV